MKSFKEYISESLNANQTSFIRNMVRFTQDSTRDTEFSDHIFGGPSSRKGEYDDHDVRIIPFNTSKLITDFPDIVKKHLDDAGYKIHNLEHGLVVRKDAPTNKPPKPIKVSKVLMANRDNMLYRDTHSIASAQWENHLEIKPHLNTGLEIMITRNPYHIAEQSTNKGWSSCLRMGLLPCRDGDPRENNWFDNDSNILSPKNINPRHATQDMTGGVRSHHLIGDIFGGTHVAYLIKHGDYKLSDPLARVSIKPYHSADIITKINRAYQRSQNDEFGPRTKWSWRENLPWEEIKPQHTILRVAPRSYRRNEYSPDLDLMKEFHSQIDKFITSEFPMHHYSDKYHIDELVYNDNEHRTLYNPDFNLNKKFTVPH